MENSKIDELMLSCMEIEKLADVSLDYDFIMDTISLIDDDILDEFRYTKEFKLFNFYVNIQKFSKTKHIEKYAIGLVNNNQENIIRYDNVPHHNENKKVQEKNPPHHKHIGVDENVVGFSGSIEEMQLGLDEILKKL